VVEAYHRLQAPRPETIIQPPAPRPAQPGVVVIDALIALARRLVDHRLADGRRIRVTLPAGLRSGDTVRAGGAELSVTLRGAPDMLVRGDDLWINAQVSPRLLAEGGRIALETPLGRRIVWLTKKAGERRLIRLVGQGLPARGRHLPGTPVPAPRAKDRRGPFRRAHPAPTLHGGLGGLTCRRIKQTRSNAGGSVALLHAAAGATDDPYSETRRRDARGSRPRRRRRLGRSGRRAPPGNHRTPPPPCATPSTAPPSASPSGTYRRRGGEGRAHRPGPRGQPMFIVGQVAHGAAFADARPRPVILFSHGFGGAARMMGWFGVPMARAGYVVVAVDHPGNNGVDKMTVPGAIMPWTRAEDLAAALAAAKADPVIGPHMDMKTRRRLRLLRRRFHQPGRRRRPGRHEPLPGVLQNPPHGRRLRPAEGVSR